MNTFTTLPFMSGIQVKNLTKGQELAQSIDQAAKDRNASVISVVRRIGISTATYHFYKKGKTNPAPRIEKKIIFGLQNLPNVLPKRTRKTYKRTVKALSVDSPIELIKIILKTSLNDSAKLALISAFLRS